MTPTQFVSKLAALNFADAFNPYADQCPVYDLEDAPTRRAQLLFQLLAAANRSEIDSIWVGRDLGFRGGRRTGLALTDDVHFHAHLARWKLKESRPTMGQPVPEKTATVIWDVLGRIERPVFLWNVFPLHPHEHDAPFTNRTHNAKERKAGVEILYQLIEMLKPKRLVAIGNDAEKALARFAGNISVVKVRHPSYGGQTVFSKQVEELYNLKRVTLL